MVIQMVRTQSYRQIPHGGMVFAAHDSGPLYIGNRASQFKEQEELLWPLVTKKKLDKVNKDHVFHWPAKEAHKCWGFFEA